MSQEKVRDSVLSSIENGARIQSRLVGVSFPCMLVPDTSRQDILAKMYEEDLRKITLVSQTDNEYDAYALMVVNEDNEDIGFVPTKGKLTLFTQGRRRPLVIGHEDIGMNLNQLLHYSISGLEYSGEITEFHTYSFDKGEGHLGASIEFSVKD